MKIRRLIPLTAVSTIVASFAPIGLTSCGQYRNIDILHGYTPGTEPILEHMFETYDEAAQYYCHLDKNILSQDYLWSLGVYVTENFEFPAPILPFKFTKIDAANISLEDWFTQPFKDESIKNVFCTSYSVVFQMSGETEPRKEYNGPYGSYIPNAYAIVSLNTRVTKLPYELKNKAVGSNKTDARWYLQPANDEILKNDTSWTVSSTATITYKKKEGPDQTIMTIDTLGSYWYSSNRYDPEKDPQKSYLYTFIYDALIYGSYHLMNCTLKN